MNKVLLVGRLGKDIELKTPKKNMSVARFNLATDGGKDESGEKITHWVPVCVWNQAADYLDQYAKKGDRIEVEGYIKTDSYDKDGKTVYTTEVTATRVSILGDREDNSRRR